MLNINNSLRVAIIGAGYVGLPLAMEFSKIYNVIVYDILAERIEELKLGEDKTESICSKRLKQSNNIF